MSAFFVGHIHFYGLSQHLFGDLGPVVAWPLIMSSTVRLSCTNLADAGIQEVSLEMRCPAIGVLRGWFPPFVVGGFGKAVVYVALQHPVLGILAQP